MKIQRSLTDSILNNIVNSISQPNKLNESISYEDKLEQNPFIMVPINHPKINEIIILLNNFEKENKEQKCIEDKKKLVITLNDISNSKEESLIIPKNSIITSLARDYIKQKNIDVIFIENKDR